MTTDKRKSPAAADRGVEDAGDASTRTGEAVIEARDLRKKYPGGKMALDGASLEIGAGEVYGLVGANGAGKTTLVRILLGLLRAVARLETLDGGHAAALPVFFRDDADGPG